MVIEYGAVSAVMVEKLRGKADQKGLMGRTHRRRTLCVLTDTFVSGGTEAVVIDMLPVLSETFDVTLFVLTGSVSEALKNRIPSDINVECGSFRWSAMNELKVQVPVVRERYFRKEIKKTFDILVILKPLCRAAGLSHIAGYNIYWNHSTHDVMYTHPEQLDPAHKLNRIRLGSIYRRFDEIWQVNGILAEEYKTAFKLKNCYSLPNPVDVSKVLKLAEEKLPDFSFSSDTFTIVMAGRLSKEKGYDRVIRAAGRIGPDAPFEIVMIGDGPEKKRLEEIAETYGIEKKVRFPGQKENPYPYVKAADVLFCPSREESFGLVMLEAMVLQTPVIATRTIGSEYVTQSGKYGLVIDNTDESISETLDKMIHYMSPPEYSLKDAFDRANEFDHTKFQKLLMHRLKSAEQAASDGAHGLYERGT